MILEISRKYFGASKVKCVMLESIHSLVLVKNTARETFESSSLKTGLSSLCPSNRIKQGEKIIQVLLKISLWSGIEGRHCY